MNKDQLHDQLQELFEIYKMEDNRYLNQLDSKILELKATLSELKNLQAQMTEWIA